MTTTVNKTAFLSGPMTWYIGYGAAPDAVDSAALGTTDDAVRIRMQRFGEPITADITGRSTIDYVYQGADVFIDMVLNEFQRTRVQQVMAPFSFGEEDWLGMGALGNTANVQVANDGNLTRPDFTRSTCQLLGVATNYHGYGIGTVPNGGEGVATKILFRNAIIAEDMALEIMHGSTLKNVPFTFRALPYETTDFPGVTGSRIVWAERL